MTVVIVSLQVTLPKQMGPRSFHSATVLGSGPNFRMVILFGGKQMFLGESIAATTLLHLGKCIPGSTHESKPYYLGVKNACKVSIFTH